VSHGPESRWPWWYGPVGFVVAVVAGTLLGSIVAALVPGGISHGNLSPSATDLATLVQDLCFVGTAVLLAQRVGPARPRSFGLTSTRVLRSAAVLVAAVVLFEVTSQIWFALLHSSGEEKELLKDVGGNGGTLDVLAACAVTCVVAPICEEILFRGFLFRSLYNWHGFWPAAIATGILFGGVHGLSAAPAVDLLPLALLGFLLCAVYRITGSLYPCIVLHVLNNAIAFGTDEHWNWRTVELAAAALATAALVLALVRLASRRWTPATG